MSSPITKLILALPSKDGRVDLHTTGWMFGFNALMAHLAIKECRLLHEAFKPVDEARNKIAQDTLDVAKGDPEYEYWTLWVDSDMAPPQDALAKLLVQMYVKPQIGLLAGFMSRRGWSDDPGLVFGENGKQLIRGRDYPTDADVIEVGWMPTGFFLMRTLDLEKIPQPWFRCDGTTGGGEDRWFSQQARKAGMRLFVHTGCPVGHADPVAQKVWWPIRAAKTFEAPVIEVTDADLNPIPSIVTLKRDDPPAAAGVTANLPKPVPVRSNGAAKKLPVELDVPDNAGTDYIASFINCDNAELFGSMATQLKGCPIVLCYDNGSFIKDAPSDILFLNSQSNLGWGPAFNDIMDYAVKRSNVRAVWICNDDILNVSAEVAQSLFDSLMATGAAAITPAVPDQAANVMHPDKRGGLRQVPFVDMTCPMISVSAWKDIGPLDCDTFGPGHGLDIDWCRRARDKGYTLWLDDAIVVRHPHPYTTCQKQGTMVEHADNGWQRKLMERYGKTVAELIYT